MGIALGFTYSAPQQRLRIFQIRGVEAFGEPEVDFGERRARFGATIRVAQQAPAAPIIWPPCVCASDFDGFF